MNPVDLETVVIPAVVGLVIFGVVRRIASFLVIALGLVVFLWAGPDLYELVRSV